MKVLATLLAAGAQANPIVSWSQGTATGRATRSGNFRPGFFRPGEKFNYEPGTRPGFEIQPGNRPEKTRKYRNLKKSIKQKILNPETGPEKPGPLPSPGWS